jgi:hypothetical protein
VRPIGLLGPAHDEKDEARVLTEGMGRIGQLDEALLTDETSHDRYHDVVGIDPQLVPRYLPRAWIRLETLDIDPVPDNNGSLRGRDPELRCQRGVDLRLAEEEASARGKRALRCEENVIGKGPRTTDERKAVQGVRDVPYSREASRGAADDSAHGSVRVDEIGAITSKSARECDQCEELWPRHERARHRYVQVTEAFGTHRGGVITVSAGERNLPVRFRRRAH